jgi:hypothetical protein
MGFFPWHRACLIAGIMASKIESECAKEAIKTFHFSNVALGRSGRFGVVCDGRRMASAGNRAVK